VLAHFCQQFSCCPEQARRIQLIHHDLNKLHLVCFLERFIIQQLVELILSGDCIRLAGYTFEAAERAQELYVIPILKEISEI
jgi:hypothetical protein